MKASLGVLALALGAVSALLGIVMLLWGLRRNDERFLRLGRRYAFFVLLASIVAVAAMEWALITHDFSIRYVAENNARATPLLFTITGLWAALEGSILLWGLVLGGYLAWMAFHFRHRATDPMVAWALVVAFVVALFFFVLMLGPANPFERLPTTPADGRGPNPLLQNHPLMAFHPPMLYLGYVGMTVPFSFAIAALITGRLGEGWLAETRRATLIAWGFLGVGILLGAWWSYEVLGWGGYWAWDPVENASLLPWLTATAFIHSVIVQERRGMLRVWNLSLVVATFCLTILGTFLTRSGVLNSVHSFSESPIGGWLLGFLAFVTIGSVVLIAWRGDQLRAPGRIDSPVSREAAFLVNNLLFAALAVVVLLGTVYPLLAEALQDRQLSVGEPYFDRMTTPIGVVLLFLMAIAPALPWRATSGDVLRRRLIVPAWFGVGVMVVTALFGVRDVWTLVTFGLAAFAVGGIVRQFALGFRAQRHAGASWWQTPWRTIRGGPRLYGGLIVHLGIVAIAIALAAATSFTTKAEARLELGESTEVAGYTFTYLRRDVESTDQKRTVKAQIRIEQGDRDLGTYAPAVSMFPGAMSGIGTPSVKTGPLRDIYLTLISAPTDRDRVTIGIAINPMVVWIWIGGGLLALGTVIALLPKSRRVVVPASADGDRGAGAGDGDGPSPDDVDEDRDVPAGVGALKHPARWIAGGVAVVLLLLAVVFATQVGNDPRADANTSRLAGKDAPKFTVKTLDGETLTQADLAGKATIVNFWNTWCIPCREEAPDLQAFYEKHADDPDFQMIGIVRDDSRSAVEKWVENRGDEWLIAMDPGGNAALAFGTRGQPETFAIGPDGLVVGYQFGPSSVADLDTLLAAARGGAGA